MSFSASPAWNSTRLCEPSATEAPISACGPEPVWPADAPGREQGHGQPAQVEHGRDAVAVEEQDPGRVRDLGVRGVERGQEDRIEEVDLAEVAGLHEPRRERHVVPEAVGAVHAGGERPQGRHHPRGGERRAGERGDHPGEPPGGRRGRRRVPAARAGRRPAWWRSGRRPGPPPPRRRARRPREPAEAAQRLADPDQARHRQHRLGQPRRRSGPARQAAGRAPGRRRRPAPPGPGRARGRRPGRRRA